MDVHHPVFAWLVEHAADLVTKALEGEDGETAWERTRGKCITIHVDLTVSTLWSQAYLDFVAGPRLSTCVAAVARLLCVAAAGCFAVPVPPAAASPPLLLLPALAAAALPAPSSRCTAAAPAAGSARYMHTSYVRYMHPF